MPLTDRKTALYTVARERIAQGNLPGTVPKSLGAGWDTGATCGSCDCTIECQLPVEIQPQRPHIAACPYEI